jgi:putative tricarboxylic transport membrane protein
MSSGRQERADARASEDVPDGNGGNSLPQNSGLLHVILNAALMAAFAYLFWAAGALPASRWEPLGSGTFPRIVLACLLVLNALTIITKASHARAEIRAHGKKFKKIASDSLRASGLVIATFAAFGVFLFAIHYLGFTLSAFLFIFVVQLMLGPITLKTSIMAFVIAAVTSLGVDFVFETYFNVFLPVGSLWR